MGRQLRVLFLCAFIFLGYQITKAQQVMQDSISTTTTITTSSLPVSNVVVTNSGNLKIISPESVIIEGPFEVMPGGTLSIDIKDPGSINFSYDNSGNRITRRFNEYEEP